MPDVDEAKTKNAGICKSFPQLIVPDRFTAFALMIDPCLQSDALVRLEPGLGGMGGKAVTITMSQQGCERFTLREIFLGVICAAACEAGRA
jgi:hypothetical protein